MPASSSARARWRKRKRDQSAARKSKLKEHENDDVFEDNEDDDDPDLDPPQTHLEAEDGHPNHSMDRTNHIMGEKESEKLVGGGVKICEFPIAIKREVNRPHSSVFQIVEAERAARNGDSRGEGQGGVAVLENISYGQLQALSAVPRDSPALLGVPTEETASGSGGGSYVITPPRIIAGHGVTKRLGSAGRVHVVPVHSGLTLQGDDSESKFPFLNSGNPVMHLVAFLASALGPRVAAACAHASLASLSKDSDKEGSPSAEMANSSRKGPWSQHDAEGVPLSAEKVNAAAKDGLVAAAMKAKLFADHEEREIQRLSANIINHQLKRLELKLKQFAEVETLLMRECEQMERARQRIASERALMMSAQFGSAGVSRPMGLPGVGNAIVNNTSGNSRQQVSGSPQTFVSGYGNNQPVHPHMSLMQQQGMYGLGPRLPLSAIHPSSSASNTMFSPTSNSQPSLGHPMLRPVWD
ncbi:UNVERIFIED_CONTAM: SWI/SNF complex subunit SWI3C [Sesamum radiatum]|uniref:SWI/SNF complex subunit SWI3C n=1 Tax=Sesamum radiatum TaxID=300843 RepID=A0AAW2SJA9_SESRA